MPKYCVKRGGDGTRYAYTPELFDRGDMDVIDEPDTDEAPKEPVKAAPKVKVEIED